MDRKLGRLIAACLVIASSAAQADDEWEYGSLTVYGVANEPCGAYVEARRAPHSAAAYGYQQFIGGFLTSSGALQHKNFPTSLAGVEVWLENYCVKKPEQGFVFALNAYVSSH